jgi:hypothetical protein
MTLPGGVRPMALSFGCSGWLDLGLRNKLVVVQILFWALLLWHGMPSSRTVHGSV